MCKEGKPITIAGVTYRYMKDAAAALGMSPSLLSLRIKRGIDPTLPVKRYVPFDEEPVGMRIKTSRTKKRKRGSQPKPVMVDGRIYDSTAEAAVRIGTSPEYLQLCLYRGKECHGHEVRRPEKIDLVLAEIEKRNKQPYQFTR